jgi:trimethylamine--corrinoid protein Co-methyltransferase
MFEGGLTWDYAQLLMQNEMARMIMHTVRGVPVNDEKMAMEVINEIGIGGEYISHEHTFQNFRELSKTDLLDRKNRDGWKAAGSPSIIDRSYEKAIDLIENHKPEPLPETVQRELARILEEAEMETKEIKAKAKRDGK